MSGFLYYIPGAADNYDPREGKLSYAFDERPAGRRCYKGPDGAEGVVFGAEGGGAVGFHPERQTWQEFKHIGCWIGYYTEDPPKESDLRRKKMLLGGQVEIAGEQWQIPIARSFQDVDGSVEAFCNLPAHIAIDPDTGEFAPGKIRAEYQPLFDAALRYWDIWWHTHIGDADEAELTEIKSDMAVDIAPYEFESITFLALGTNYRIGPSEAHAVEMLSSDECFEILAVIADLESFNEIVKKIFLVSKAPIQTMGSR